MITKHLKFRDQYDSEVLNAKDNELWEQNGLIQGGQVTLSGLTATIQPLIWIQNGLVVQEDTAATVALTSANLEVPHFLCVTTASNVQSPTEVLGTTIIEKPEDANLNIVPIAEWDGTAYRMLPYLSIGGILENFSSNALSDALSGIKNGFESTNTGGMNYQVAPGQIRDKTGRLITTLEPSNFTVNAMDPDYPNRVDQFIFRTPLDSPVRVGTEQYIPGDAFKLTGQLDIKSASPAVSDKEKAKTKIFTPALLGKDVFMFLDDYSAAEELKYGQYSLDILTQQSVGAPPGPLANTSSLSDYDACVDDAGNTYYIGTSSANTNNLLFNSVNTAGVKNLGSDVQTVEPNPSLDYRIFIDQLRSKLYIFWRTLSAGVYSIRYMSTSLIGASITSPVTLVQLAGSASVDSYDVAIDFNDATAFVAYASSGVVSMQKYNLDSGNSVTPPSVFINYGVISNNSALYPARTPVTGACTNPRVRAAGNKEVYCFFQQVYSGSNRSVAIYNPNYLSVFGFSSLIPFNPPTGDCANFNVALNDTNYAYFAMVLGASGAQTIYENKFYLYDLSQEFSYNIETNYTIDGIDIKKNQNGVMLLSYISRPDAIGNVNNNSPVDALAFGPGAFNTYNLTQEEFVCNQSDINGLPRTVEEGDVFTVTGAGANNGATGTIISITPQIIGGNPYYIILTSNTFTYQTGSIAVQFSYESGEDQVRIVKTTAAVNTYDVRSTPQIPSDLWTARVRCRSNAVPIITPYFDLFNNFDAIGTNQNIQNIYDYINFELTGGGALSWGLSPNPATTLQWTGTINIILHGRDSFYTIPANSVTINNGQVAYFTLPIVPNSNAPLTVNVIDSNRFTPDRNGQRSVAIAYASGGRLYSRFAPFILDIGEQASQGFGQTVSDELLTFMGATSDVDSMPAYTSTHFVNTGDSLVKAISELDAELYYLATQLPDEDVLYFLAPTSTITAPTLTWIFDNTIPDLTVWKNGQKLQQETVALVLNPSTTEDYRKLSTSMLTFAVQFVPGDKLVLRKENSAGSSGSGNISVEQNNVNVSNGVNTLNFNGPGWNIVDAGGGQINVGFAGGSGSSAIVKTVYNNSGFNISNGLPVAWAADGSVFLAEADMVNDTNFAGVTVGPINNAGYGLVIKQGNVPGVLMGLGATPGQEIFLGTTPGSFTLTAPAGPAASIIKLGIAEPPDGVFTNVANDLFIEFEVISQP